MLIEGEHYRTRDGRKAGPAEYSGPCPDAPSTEWMVRLPDGHPATYLANGRRIADGYDDDDDLIAPWSEPADVNTPTPRTIYLSGPMKGYPGSNYPLFNAVADQLRRAGHRVYNPAEFGADKPFDGFPIREAFAAYSKFICEEADAIVLLPGWEASKGANAERALADNCGIEIIPFDRLSTTITTEGTF